MKARLRAILFRWLAPWRAWRLRCEARRIHAAMVAAGVEGDDGALADVRVLAGIDTPRTDFMRAQTGGYTGSEVAILRKGERIERVKAPTPEYPYDTRESLSKLSAKELAARHAEKLRAAMSYIDARRNEQGVIRMTAEDVERVRMQEEDLRLVRARIEQARSAEVWAAATQPLPAIEGNRSDGGGLVRTETAIDWEDGTRQVIKVTVGPK